MSDDPQTWRTWQEILENDLTLCRSENSALKFALEMAVKELRETHALMLRLTELVEKMRGN
ncbi:MAG TPA: hypothetical protein VN903_35030 [Polyangia bacterium]|nr:hypothetical protein [Polyangia bacterium]